MSAHNDMAVECENRTPLIKFFPGCRSRTPIPLQTGMVALPPLTQDRHDRRDFMKRLLMNQRRRRHDRLLRKSPTTDATTTTLALDAAAVAVVLTPALALSLAGVQRCARLCHHLSRRIAKPRIVAFRRGSTDIHFFFFYFFLYFYFVRCVCACVCVCVCASSIEFNRMQVAVVVRLEDIVRS